MVKYIIKWYLIFLGGINLVYIGYLMFVNKEKKEWRLSKYFINFVNVCLKFSKRVRNNYKYMYYVYINVF